MSSAGGLRGGFGRIERSLICTNPVNHRPKTRKTANQLAAGNHKLLGSYPDKPCDSEYSGPCKNCAPTTRCAFFTADELGCYLSHYGLYRRIVDQDIDLALIMEDDIEISPDLPQIVDGLVRAPDWLVVRLESLRGGVLRPRSAKAMGRRVADAGPAGLYRLDTHTLGLGAYLIRKDGARRMLDYGRSIFMPIDHTMDRYWENGIAPYVVRPFPVRQLGDFHSRIGRRDPMRRRSLPLPVRIGHRLQRVQDSIGKRIWRLGAGG